MIACVVPVVFLGCDFSSSSEVLRMRICALCDISCTHALCGCLFLSLARAPLSLPLPPTHPPPSLMGMFLVCFRDQDADADDFIGKFSVSVAQIIKENKVWNILSFVSLAKLLAKRITVSLDHSFLALLFVDTLSQLAFALLHQSANGCWWSGTTAGFAWKMCERCSTLEPGSECIPEWCLHSYRLKRPSRCSTSPA